MLDAFSLQTLGWTVLVVAALPLLTIVFTEWARRAGESRGRLRRLLSLIALVTLPVGAIGVLCHMLLDISADSLAGRLIDGAIGLVLLYTLLAAARVAVDALAARAGAPQLLYDVTLAILAMLGGAAIFSQVFGFSLAGIFSALGVGSIAMGFALQSVLGGMLNGVLMVSARKFGLGDFIEHGDLKGDVVEIDWRSVSLLVDPGEVLVVPSATLASGALKIYRKDDEVVLNCDFLFGHEYRPEQVRALLLEAARGSAFCVNGQALARIGGYSPQGVVYTVTMRVASRNARRNATNDLYSRVWYVAQRHGVSVAPRGRRGNLPEHGRDAADRASLLIGSGAFGRRDAICHSLAQAGRIELWRVGELYLGAGADVDQVAVVLSGGMRLSRERDGRRVDIEHIGAGQILALREALRAAPCPVDVEIEKDSEILALPASVLQEAIRTDAGFAAEIEILLETRARAIAAVVSPAGVPAG